MDDVPTRVASDGMNRDADARRIRRRERVPARDDDTHLFAGTEQGAGRPDLDFDRNDLATFESLLALIRVKRLKRLALRNVDFAMGNTQPPVRGVPEAKPGDVIKIDQFARLIELLTGREQVHVVCTVRLNPELELEIARQFGVLGECE